MANGCAVLSVADSGSGIAPEHLPYVFDRFYKVDPARAAAGAGSGLGLSIAKAIVVRHGGTIAVASVPGSTRFIISLPQAAHSTSTNL
jgi:signal transduction histidine kinase